MSQAEVLARDVLLLSRNTLLVHLRFLDTALSQFVFTPALLPFATDGRKLHYAPRHVLLCPQCRRQASETADSRAEPAAQSSQAVHR